jgi:3'-phosphoadenosine 5'-phosphosulfate sulfotransferase (PAPS reductase)/FAD synthetase
MEQVKQRIKEVLKDSLNPACLVSFGKDSLLLLALTLEVRPDITTLWFNQRSSRAQRKYAERIIKEWDLTVFAYAPRDSYFIPNNESLTLVDEMSFGETSLPLLTDTREGDACALTLKGEQTPYFGYNFDITLFGYKRSDAHASINQRFAREYGLGSTRLVAPLYDLTDEEVLGAIKDLGIPYEEIDDQLPVCTRCLNSKGRVFCPDIREEIGTGRLLLSRSGRDCNPHEAA